MANSKAREYFRNVAISIALKELLNKTQLLNLKHYEIEGIMFSENTPLYQNMRVIIQKTAPNRFCISSKKCKSIYNAKCADEVQQLDACENDTWKNQTNPNTNQTYTTLEECRNELFNNTQLISECSEELSSDWLCNCKETTICNGEEVVNSSTEGLGHLVGKTNATITEVGQDCTIADM